MAPLSLSLAGRVALITGAARGIGWGMAEALAAAGCAVAVQDIDLPAARAAVAALTAAGAKAVALDGDVADLELPPRLVAQTIDQLGGLHILINNASIQLAGHWRDMAPAEMQRELSADLIAPVLLAREAAKVMVAQKFGRIINVGSIQQQRGNPKMLAYSMAKAALVNATTALAHDLAADAVTVNLIAPGFFNTWRNRDHLPTPQVIAEKGAKFVPMGRIGQPEDCGGLAVLLASDAGRYITGQIIYVDGGMSVR